MAPPPALETLVKEAGEAYQAEEYRIAASRYEAAAAEYTQAGNGLMAAEMSNNRSVALLKGGDAAAAYRAAEGTDRIFAAAGDMRRQAIALSNLAAALEGQQKSEEALPLYRQSADLFQQVNEPEMRTYVLKSLSLIQFRKGKRFEAMASMRAALEGQKRLGPRDQVLRWLLQIVFRLLGGR